ncbi:golgi-specific brefeldin A-resistance guanine nucleotide exchange factor 1 [Platysternon megacephalum]|uniref:Golgi-specific brefeldin A-resistance guanine nucleotide exchange factor 1 n=1 Tax=Platysternon megacephalum TaxID=55544 RepID=A0A4D9E042_9SAUR|nr:golgi-specific brefeldin A-resistance guanine nucleotide exchange factor 1 [Platysternon megacephalum]
MFNLSPYGPVRTNPDPNPCSLGLEGWVKWMQGVYVGTYQETTEMCSVKAPFILSMLWSGRFRGRWESIEEGVQQWIHECIDPPARLHCCGKEVKGWSGSGTAATL